MYGILIHFSDGRSEILSKKFRSSGAARSEIRRLRTGEQYSNATFSVLTSRAPSTRRGSRR